MAAKILAEPRRFRWMLSRASEAHVGILSSQQITLKCFCYFKAFTCKWQKATQFECKRFLLLPNFGRFHLDFSSVTEISALIWS